MAQLLVVRLRQLQHHFGVSRRDRNRRLSVAFGGAAAVAFLAGSFVTHGGDARSHQASKPAHPKLGLVSAIQGSHRSAASPPSGLTPAFVARNRLVGASIETLMRAQTPHGSFTVEHAVKSTGEECLYGVSDVSIGGSCGGIFDRGPVAFGESVLGGPALSQRTAYTLSVSRARRSRDW